MRQRIAIIGGGIAGLAFAVYYKNLGGRVDIYERSARSGREGLGFIMLENGIDAISKLGLREEFLRLGYPLKNCEILDHFGNHINDEPFTESYGVTRKAFVDMLLNHIPEDWLHFEHQFSHFEWDRQGKAYRAYFENQTFVEADLFIGCDGANSKVRRHLFPNAQRSQVKVKELVSIVESPDIYSELENKFVKYKHLDGGLAVGMLPASNKKIVWYIQYDAKKFLLTTASKKIFAEQNLKNWPSIVQRLIEHTNFDFSHIWQTSYLNPLDNFHKNNVVLIGDAAHALLPFTSQGVNSAIEDAVQLIELLEHTQPGFTTMAMKRFSLERKRILDDYLKQGIDLQNEFLSPHHESQKIPFVF